METLAFFTKQSERPYAMRNEDSYNNDSSRPRPYSEQYPRKPHSPPRMAGFVDVDDELQESSQKLASDNANGEKPF